MTKQTKSKTKRQTNPILLSRDRDILFFLWRHRISTLLAIKEIFFPDGINDDAYLAMRRLRWGGYIEMPKIDGTPNRVFCLALRGYRYLLCNGLSEPRTKMFRPQSQYHDLFTAAVLLGRWACKQPSSVRIVSEQELVSTDIEEIPRDVRKSLDRTPDGLWIFKNATGHRAIALEVELAAKTTTRYEGICATYTSHIFFEHVIWIVSDKTLGSRILDASRKHGIPRDGQHLFILKSDFEKYEWLSPFQNRSMDNMTLADLLNQKARVAKPVYSKLAHPVVDLSKTYVGQNSISSPFLNFRFSLKKLDAYEKSKLTKIS